MYRSLERLKEPILVLHGFTFTHDQYRICDRNHDTKKCPKCNNKTNKNSEECDFLIVGPNYFVVIEVKNSKPEYDPRRSLEKSIEQRNRVRDLIHVMDERAKVFLFTSFPSLHSEQFDADEVEKNCIIFEEDIGDFGKYWDIKVTGKMLEDCTEGQSDQISDYEFNRIKSILVAISCTETDEPDENRFSLAKTVMRIDADLKGGQITLEQKVGKISKDKRSYNPAVRLAPEVIAKFVGVKYLTPQQEQILQSNQNVLLINGPAGSGKTALLAGKMVELAKTQDRKVIVFKITGSNVNFSQTYQRTCKKAGIEYELVSKGKRRDYKRTEPKQIAHEMLESNKKVIIVEIRHTFVAKEGFPEVYRALSNCHVIIDDLHAYYFLTNIVLESLFQMDRLLTVWASFDLAQRYNAYYSLKTARAFNFKKLYFFIEKNLAPENVVTLRSNLRNTFDLANFLAVIRQEYIGLVSDGSEIADKLLPSQIKGHFIHGPLPVIHVLKDNSQELVDKILGEELKTLHELLDEFEGINVAVCFMHLSDATKATMNKKINEGYKEKTLRCHGYNGFSAEWPVTIALLGIDTLDKKEYDSMMMYLMTSRARVRCTLVLIPEGGLVLQDYTFMMDLLRKLQSFSHVRYHGH
ncbi:hypothetical protein ACHWQZ_G010639 [Mnemiopsis leidyi]